MFCDISKAFDRVWHEGLLVKLKAYGIDKNVFLWIKSYLSKRRQRVFVKKSVSSELYINAGVPQGSVLGPLLFLIFINDISDDLDSFTRLFADDTSLGCSSKSQVAIQNTLNSDLEKLHRWSIDWMVNFNPNKTKAIYFTNQTVAQEPIITFNNQQVELVDRHKHLGVILSSNCKWTAHVDSLCLNASRQLGVLRSLKFTLNRSNLSKIYHTYILPLLEYACELWDGCTLECASKLDKIHHEAARIVTGLPRYARIESLYFETGWETLADRRRRRKLCLFHRIHNGRVPGYLSDCLTPIIGNTNRYNLRNQENYVHPQTRIETFSRSFIPSTTILWNSLDLRLRNIPTLDNFKRVLKNQNPTIQPPSYYSYGNRKLNILHTRLRHMSSTLKADLFRVGIVADQRCSCGWPVEDSIHFFLECPLYTVQRGQYIDILPDTGEDKITLILFGSYVLDRNANVANFETIQQFIRHSGRFSLD